MENLAFQSLLRLKIIILPILTTSLIHFSSEGWENVIKFKFPLPPHQRYYITQYEELSFS